jgi:hypothetical protein
MFDLLVSKIHETVDQMADHRKTDKGYALTDMVMSGFAMFSLKDPSLLAFKSSYEARQENLEQVFKIKAVPSDNGLRKILDPVNPTRLLPCFEALYKEPKVEVVVKERLCFTAFGGFVAIAADGTEHFCSNHTNCPHCMVRKLKDGGVQYYHQMVGACIVKPNEKTVLPVFAEPITRQDGATKNDCEYNAFKRLLPNIGQVLPGHKKLILLDGLFADGPAIRAIRDGQMDFITVIKEGYVLVQAARLEETGQLESFTWTKNQHFRGTAKWAHGLVLNGANQDISVNYLQYQEVDTRNGKTVYASKWITSLEISQDMAPEFVSVARSRWKIENETFNVLKNHGYNLEHNYGHGKSFLSSVLAILMFLAFLVDQLTEATDSLFQKALKAAKTMRDMRQKVRVLFDIIPCMSMNVIYGIIARDLKLGLSL